MLCSCIQVCQQETASVILRFNKMWAIYLADGKKTQNKDKANWDKTKLGAAKTNHENYDTRT